MELLSPVSDMASLKAAVQNGADAVYLGGAYSARRNAKPMESLADAAAYARMYGVKLYYVLNTLVYDREFDLFLNEAKTAAKAGANAFIAQDIGAFKLLRQAFPDMPLHVSTQACVHNTDNIKYFETLGASRVVLARELSQEQISRIARATPLQIEVFAHGALCYSFSGQCLMSSFLGGRSANRGECAQPCRHLYACRDKKGYLLSTKDLCLVDEITRLSAAGVHCVKIEGRMKGADYVAAATRAYRKALDGVPLCEDDYRALYITYNRGGFTKGLFLGDTDRLYTKKPGHTGLPAGKITDVQGDEIIVKSIGEISVGDEIACDGVVYSRQVLQLQKTECGYKLKLLDTSGFNPGNNVYITYSKALPDSLNAGVSRRLQISGNAVVKQHEPVSLALSAGNNMLVKAVGVPPQKARGRALSQQDIRLQLDKLGNTNFEFGKLDIITDDESWLPKSALNALRRDAVGRLEQKLSSPPYVRIISINEPKRSTCNARRHINAISAHVTTFEQGAAIINAVDNIYAPAKVCKELEDKFGNMRPKTRLAAELPVITTDDALAALKKDITGISEVLCHTYTDIACQKTAGHGFNITNSRTLHVLWQSGFKRAVLSPELSAAQIRDLCVPDGLETEVIAYGRIPLMTSLNCPIGCDGADCRVADGELFLRDRKNMALPILKAGQGCNVAVLNALPIFMADKLHDICADVCCLYFTVETPQECVETVGAYRRAINGEPVAAPSDGTFTRGHFYKKIGKREKGTGNRE